MTIKTTQKGLKKVLGNDLKSGIRLGLVPTMGALHEGHFSLLKKALSQCDRVVLSIFVNPTQFNNKSDLVNYPNNTASDLEKLQQHFDDIIVFMPSTEEIYGNTLTAQHFDFGGLENKMEGAFRPGHFDGVGTILSTLFHLIQPHRAYFGEKDFQQLQIVRRLVKILELPIEIVGCPIYREENGLAQSSRNERLTEVERQKAVLLYTTLSRAREEFGTIPVEDIIKNAELKFKKDSAFKLDYFTIAREDTLESVTQIENGTRYRAFVAAFLGSVRLIDNMALN